MISNFNHVPGHESYLDVDSFVTSTQHLGGFEYITENFKVDLCLWRASEAKESRPTECVSNPQLLLFPPGANIQYLEFKHRAETMKPWHGHGLQPLRCLCIREKLV